MGEVRITRMQMVELRGRHGQCVFVDPYQVVGVQGTVIAAEHHSYLVLKGGGSVTVALTAQDAHDAIYQARYQLAEETASQMDKLFPRGGGGDDDAA